MTIVTGGTGVRRVQRQSGTSAKRLSRPATPGQRFHRAGHAARVAAALTSTSTSSSSATSSPERTTSVPTAVRRTPQLAPTGARQPRVRRPGAGPKAADPTPEERESLYNHAKKKTEFVKWGLVLQVLVVLAGLTAACKSPKENLAGALLKLLMVISDLLFEVCLFVNADAEEGFLRRERIRRRENDCLGKNMPIDDLSRMRQDDDLEDFQRDRAALKRQADADAEARKQFSITAAKRFRNIAILGFILSVVWFFFDRFLGSPGRLGFDGRRVCTGAMTKSVFYNYQDILRLCNDTCKERASDKSYQDWSVPDEWSCPDGTAATFVACGDANDETCSGVCTEYTLTECTLKADVCTKFGGTGTCNADCQPVPGASETDVETTCEISSMRYDYGTGHITIPADETHTWDRCSCSTLIEMEAKWFEIVLPILEMAAGILFAVATTYLDDTPGGSYIDVGASLGFHVRAVIACSMLSSADVIAYLLNIHLLLDCFIGGINEHVKIRHIEKGKVKQELRESPDGRVLVKRSTDGVLNDNTECNKWLARIWVFLWLGGTSVILVLQIYSGLNLIINSEDAKGWTKFVVWAFIVFSAFSWVINLCCDGKKRKRLKDAKYQMEKDAENSIKWDLHMAAGQAGVKKMAAEGKCVDDIRSELEIVRDKRDLISLSSAAAELRPPEPPKYIDA